jgi:hypothetical protein
MGVLEDVPPRRGSVENMCFFSAPDVTARVWGLFRGAHMDKCADLLALYTASDRLVFALFQLFHPRASQGGGCTGFFILARSDRNLREIRLPISSWCPFFLFVCVLVV